MLKKVTALTLVFLMTLSTVFALEGFERKELIKVPEADLNNGGVGNMISGCDIDEDGLPEIYLVNDNWNDEETEVIPRIYKLEDAGSGWEVVWSATIEPFYQNSWPCLSIADLDKDGKQEIVWGPVNSTSVTANPNRVIVYEHAGGDVFGIDDGEGNYTPNSVWTMVSEDDVNLRPMDWAIKDLDNDGTDEIFFADRKGGTGGYYFGAISVDNIPDDGDGSETWTMEVSGKNLSFNLGENIQNKWAVGSIGSSFYAFDEEEISKVNWTGTEWEYSSLSPIIAGSPNQGVASVDLDSDGTTEMIAAVYDWGDDTQKGFYLLQEDADTLKHTLLVSVADYFDSRGLWGMDCADIDGDGYLDFVVGSREGTTLSRIFRLSYKGGAIDDPASYELTIIDEGFSESGGIWSVINVANVDSDPELEVLYTSSTPHGGALGTSDTTAPIIVLDYKGGSAIDEGTINIADQYVLHQNYPNPFNPTTNIAFQIPQNENIKVVVYDMVGHKVRTLVNAKMNAGYHTIQWDGRDANGRMVSTGIYLYQLQTSSMIKTRKMTFIK